MLSFLAVAAFTAAACVRDGALKMGGTHLTRFYALVLLIISAACAVQQPEAALVAAAMAPADSWAAAASAISRISGSAAGRKRLI